MYKSKCEKGKNLDTEKNSREKHLERFNSVPIPGVLYSTQPQPHPVTHSAPEEGWEEVKALYLPPGELSPVIGTSIRMCQARVTICPLPKPSRVAICPHASPATQGHLLPPTPSHPVPSHGASCRAPCQAGAAAHLSWRCTGS